MATHLIAQIEKHHKRGEYGRAIYACEQLLADPAYQSHRAILLFWKGMSHYKAGPSWRGQAISCLREAMAAASKDRPTKGRIMVALGMIYAYMGDYVAFEKMLKEWERISRDRQPEVMRWGPMFWYNYGCALDNACRYAEAISVYQKALSLCQWAENMRSDVLHNLSGAYLYSGDLPQALATMEQAETLQKNDPTTLSRKAEYAFAVGDYTTAQQYVAEALLHPAIEHYTRGDAYYTWAQVLLALDQPQEAQEKALQALDYAIRSVHLPCIHKTNIFLQQFGSPVR
ncbi:MAG: Tetratricopeptide 2 repeat protein [Symbiobacteriaceae bacterium]|nr:Tetratricopeptide 2 repeat protein [Symbiobacteriaceae bacterium]